MIKKVGEEELVVNVRLTFKKAVEFIEDILDGKNKIIGEDISYYVLDLLKDYLESLGGEEGIKRNYGDNSRLTWILIGFLKFGRAMIYTIGFSVSFLLDIFARLVFVERCPELLIRIVQKYFSDSIIDQIVQSCIKATEGEDYAVESIDYKVIERATGSNDDGIFCDFKVQIIDAKFNFLESYIERMKAKAKQESEDRAVKLERKEQEDKEKVEEYKSKSSAMGFVAFVGAVTHSFVGKFANYFVDRVTDLGSATQSAMVSTVNSLAEEQLKTESAAKLGLANELITWLVTDSWLKEFMKEEFGIEEDKLKIDISLSKD